MAKKKVEEEKDLRYKVVKHLIEAKEIKTFKEIFIYIPKTTVAKALHKNNNRMGEMIEKPTDFTLEEIVAMAKLFETDVLVLTGLMVKSAHNKTKKEK